MAVLVLKRCRSYYTGAFSGYSVNLISDPLMPSCCHTGTAIKHPVADRVKPTSFVIFDIRAFTHIRAL